MERIHQFNRLMPYIITSIKSIIIAYILWKFNSHDNIYSQLERLQLIGILITSLALGGSVGLQDRLSEGNINTIAVISCVAGTSVYYHVVSTLPYTVASSIISLGFILGHVTTRLNADGKYVLGALSNTLAFLLLLLGEGPIKLLALNLFAILGSFYYIFWLRNSLKSSIKILNEFNSTFVILAAQLFSLMQQRFILDYSESEIEGYLGIFVSAAIFVMNASQITLAQKVQYSKMSISEECKKISIISLIVLSTTLYFHRVDIFLYALGISFLVFIRPFALENIRNHRITANLFAAALGFTSMVSYSFFTNNNLHAFALGSAISLSCIVLTYTVRKD